MNERYFLKPSTQWVRQADNGIIIIGRKTVAFPRGGERLVKTLETLRYGATVRELSQIIESETVANLSIRKLKQIGFLTMAKPGSVRLDHLEKQANFFAEYVDDVDGALRNLKNAHVLIVGCGGTGSLVAEGLASAGVGEITGIDDDVVQLSNLNRQYAFSRSDCGRKKPDALKDFLLARWPDLVFNAISGRIERAATLDALLGDRHVDLVVCCADTPPIVIQLALCEWARVHHSSIIFGAVGLANGHVGPLLTNELDMLSHENVLQEALKVIGSSKLRPHSGSIGWTNALISALVTGETVRFLSGYLAPSSKNQVLEYDFENHKTCRRELV
jgi:molybdopterin/thiamine biosynthesis adenylyltransferase